MKKKFAATFLALAFAFANFGILPALAAGNATITLQPTSTATKVGDSFNVNVLVNPNGASLDTVRVELGYDALKLQATLFTLGTQFQNLSPSNSINNQTGKLSYGAYTFGTPVSSSGMLGTVTFKALAAATTSTISVLTTSKLITDGTEHIASSGLGSAVVAIGATTIPPKPTAPVVPATPAVPAVPALPVKRDLVKEQAAIVQFVALYKRLPSSAADWKWVNDKAYGASTTTTSTTTTTTSTSESKTTTTSNTTPIVKRDLALEQAAITKFVALYKRLPSTSADWKWVHVKAYGTSTVVTNPATSSTSTTTTTTTTPSAPATTVKRDLVKEQAAIVQFVALYKKLPSTSTDWKWVNEKAYGTSTVVTNPATSSSSSSTTTTTTTTTPSVPATTVKRDLVKEQAAIVQFVALYKRLPSSAADWKWVNDKAYGGTMVETPVVPAKPVVTVAPVTPVAPVTTNLTLQQQAIGWFGKLSGHAPSATVEWLAVKYMVEGYTPAKRDLAKESAAIKKFAATFAHVPTSDQDWNIIAAIAYSGAFTL